MRLILKRREFLPDRWRYLGEEVAEGDALIVPLAAMRAERAHWWQWPGRLGVRLSPAEAVENLAEELPRLDLVAVEFPGPGEGRGYSAGRLLRERFGFRGELRAVGNGVRQDQVFLLSRCGFDAIELAEGEDREAARRALTRYDVAYQPGDAAVALRRQRLFV